MESLMQDLVREKEIRDTLPEDSIVDEIIAVLEKTKKSQDNQAEILQEMHKQKNKLSEVVMQPGIVEAMAHPLKAKICSLLSSKSKK